MTVRTIVGACGLVALLGVAVYLLFQVAVVFAVGGVVVLVAILLALGVDRPDAL